MYIKVTKSVVHLGYGYRIGFTGDVSNEIAKELIRMERAVALPPLKKEVKPKVKEDEKEEEPIVHKAVVRKTRKRKA